MMTWKCFFCLAEMATDDEARDHFGLDEEWTPGCVDQMTRNEIERRKWIIELNSELEKERNENSELQNKIYLYERDQADLQRVFGVKTVLQAAARFEDLKFELAVLKGEVVEDFVLPKLNQE